MADLIEIVVPGLGESVSEATIAKWNKDDGDSVGPNDVIVELETDKAAVEIPAGRAGTLKLVAKKGDTVKVGDVIARVDPAGKRRACQSRRPPKPRPPRPRSKQKSSISNPPASMIFLPPSALRLSKTSSSTPRFPRPDRAVGSPRKMYRITSSSSAKAAPPIPSPPRNPPKARPPMVSSPRWAPATSPPARAKPIPRPPQPPPHRARWPKAKSAKK